MKNIAFRNWHWLGLESETGYLQKLHLGTENNYVLKGQNDIVFRKIIIIRFRNWQLLGLETPN